MNPSKRLNRDFRLYKATYEKYALLIVEIALNLRFSPRDKCNFRRIFIAYSIKDFSHNNIGGFVSELSAFDEFEDASIAINFSKPTDIFASFGLESDVSGYFFTKLNLDLPVAVNSFVIDIRVTVSDGPTSN